MSYSELLKSARVIYTQKDCTIQMIEGSRFLFINMIGYMNPTDHKLFCENILEAMIEHQVQALLFNMKAYKIISPESQTWLVENWSPRAWDAGYRYCGIITSNDLFGKTSTEKVMKSAEEALETQYFNDNDLAFEWISSVSSPIAKKTIA
ncbi:MAG: hypothetical protein LAT68_03900 [Cyclobacteriaceae bacterium]|nr:hypothetical protein [Cyclobacteriaceae bacterium]MCH8515452.1 hypothetical protein [Cyclobacteriaceae bacterium]